MVNFRFLYQQLSDDQRGSVSILISLVVMTILSLVTMSFVYLVNTHFLESVDIQYSLQAHYVAQTGINDARAELQRQILADLRNPNGSSIEIVYHQSQIIDKDALSSASLHIQDGDNFGQALTIADDLLIVGVPGKGANNNGTVYILSKDSNQEFWQADQAVEIDFQGLNNIAAQSAFGSAVSFDGNYLAVGAPGADGGKGAVYVLLYDGVNWQLDSIINNDLSNINLPVGANFGASVVLKDNLLIIGAPGADGGKGAVYVSNISNWQQINTSLNDSTLTGISLANNDNFGQALSFDGHQLAVGAPGSSNNQGTIYIIDYENNSWDTNIVVQIKDQAGGAVQGETVNHLELNLNDRFGVSVVISNGLLQAGIPSTNSNQGSLHILEAQGNQWFWRHRISSDSAGNNQFQIALENDEQFGMSLAFSQGTLVVGAPGYQNNQGRIHFFGVVNDNLLRDTWDFGGNKGCPSATEIHPSWQQGYLDEDQTVGYSCVIVDLTPQDIIYDSVSENRSLLMPMLAIDDDQNHRNLEDLIIEWDAIDPNSVSGRIRQRAVDDPFFPQHADWQADVPVLRLQLTIVDISQSFDRETLNYNTEVFFLYPTQGDGDHDAYGGKGVPNNLAVKELLHKPGDQKEAFILDSNCQATREPFLCRASLKDLPLSEDLRGGVSDGKLVYILRLQSIYRPARLKVTAIPRDLNNQSLSAADLQALDWGFQDLQAVIRATGRVHNITTRLEERMPLRPLLDIPEYAIDVETDICKITVSTDVEGTHIDPFVAGELGIPDNHPSCDITY